MSQQSQITIELLRAKAAAFSWRADWLRETHRDRTDLVADAVDECARDLADTADRIAMAGEEA